VNPPTNRRRPAGTTPPATPARRTSADGCSRGPDCSCKPAPGRRLRLGLAGPGRLQSWISCPGAGALRQACGKAFMPNLLAIVHPGFLEGSPIGTGRQCWPPPVSPSWSLEPMQASNPCRPRTHAGPLQARKVGDYELMKAHQGNAQGRSDSKSRHSSSERSLSDHSSDHSSCEHSSSDHSMRAQLIQLQLVR
jgi:hypothetical protein